jgi:SAM-dependent methyltransferase
MRRISEVMLREPLSRGGQAVLDAGCGTGGFLAWLATTGAFTRLVGTDIAIRAIELAGERVPSAELRAAPLHELPFADAEFDVVTVNDVLQHVPERTVGDALRECGRVLRPGGRLLIRTNGALRARRERDDWRAYDRVTLAKELRGAGLHPERLTYAALVPSLWAVARGEVPRAPEAGEAGRHGVPKPSSAVAARAGRATTAAECAWLARSGRTIPFGHTLFAVVRSGP